LDRAIAINPNSTQAIVERIQKNPSGAVLVRPSDEYKRLLVAAQAAAISENRRDPMVNAATTALNALRLQSQVAEKVAGSFPMRPNSGTSSASTRHTQVASRQAAPASILSSPSSRPKTASSSVQPPSPIGSTRVSALDRRRIERGIASTYEYGQSIFAEKALEHTFNVFERGASRPAVKGAYRLAGKLVSPVMQVLEFKAQTNQNKRIRESMIATNNAIKAQREAKAVWAEAFQERKAAEKDLLSVNDRLSKAGVTDIAAQPEYAQAFQKLAALDAKEHALFANLASATSTAVDAYEKHSKQKLIADGTLAGTVRDVLFAIPYVGPGYEKLKEQLLETSATIHSK
jgi:hypothetical protein